MKKIIVVGGGIAGLLSAQILSKKAKVYLIEKDSDLGGLLKSKNDFNITFDMGTHILRESPNAEVNQYITGIINKQEWNTFDNLKVGNYFENSLYEFSQAIDIRKLPQETYRKIVFEIINNINIETKLTSAKDYFLSRFGETYYEIVCKPQLLKFFGTVDEDLSFECAQILGMTRVIGFDENITDELKTIPGLDHRIAFNTFEKGVGILKNLYPKKWGIGKWVKNIEEDLIDSNVIIKKNCEIISLKQQNGSLEKVILNDGEELEVDEVIWTIPPIFFLKHLGVNLELQPPKIRKAFLFNYLFENNFLVKNHYIHCYDSSKYAFRVTLYSNLRGDDIPSCTVEVITNEPFNAEEMLVTIHKELIDMQIVSVDNKVLSQFCHVPQGGFPLLTMSMKKQTLKIVEECNKHCNNVKFLGRAKGTSFFMSDIINEVVSEIN
jgi:protoporphyrinogen oxidase